MKNSVGTSSKGFTIVELLIVVVVIAILAAITIVAYNGVSARAKTSKVSSDAVSILKKLEIYKSLSGDNGYPLPDVANHNWYDQSDLSSPDPSTKLPANLRVVRGDDNAPDSDAIYSSVVSGSEASPAGYAFVVCTSGGTSVGVKVAYPDYSSQTVKWLRSGAC